MRVKIKETGEIKEVTEIGFILYLDKETGCEYSPLEVEIGETIEGLITRDEDGLLSLWEEGLTPVRINNNSESDYEYWGDPRNENNSEIILNSFISISRELFPEITWESEPRKAKITIELI